MCVWKTITGSDTFPFPERRNCINNLREGSDAVAFDTCLYDESQK